MAVKIKDVAKKAGVSVTTVSRVLNDGKYVSDELKEKVKKAIEELNYSPSFIARSLVLKKTNLLAVIVPNITASVNSIILSKIEETASKNNYNIIVCNMAENLDKQYKYLNIFKEMRVDGIIITNEKIDDKTRDFLESINIPIVFASAKPSNQKHIAIVVNNYQAAYDAAEYLTSLGHKRIAFIGGDRRDITSGQERYNGYRNALKNNKIPLVEEYVEFGNYSLQDGYSIMNKILKCKKLPTAVFAASDDMAVGAINCIKDNGLKVPDDISVIGFDGTAVVDIVRPRLTSMEQPIKEMGTMAVEMLIQKINKQQTLVNEVIVNHELVVRDSCKKV
ncbi:LacI family DNA-binding transcriptional regulator [Vallitalea guaymasensis]|uniref:LacI family DNA-binding transcriptional regulator n=1 Tax=Vallitalea guaymasensis TaxID=1185412 RepID=A0A8J8MAS5_9FIRM|nr:LacI family DNA-binding transcriptional regulator [Vallitalea guaymasensis]QUH29280.1 LacI family DNA-binding transcriptional regulator [Vallitalea guaymasensis]